MRWVLSSVIASAALLLGASARGAEGNRGGPGPSSGPSGGGPQGASFGETEQIGADVRAREQQAGTEIRAKKPWEVQGIWETHHMVRQDDLAGYGVNKTVNVGFLYARYNFTPYDRVWIRGGMYQRFMADEQETGFRADDLVGAYTRTIPLPERFSLRITPQLSAPTSFVSQKEGLITEGRLTLRLDERIDRFTFTARTYGAIHIMKYTSAEGGSANPKWLWIADLGVEYSIPYIEVLDLGVSVTNQYLWLYETGYVQNAPNSQRYGAVEDRNYGLSQPVQQSYGAEAYLRYRAPELAGVKADLTLSYAQGDPSLGYTSALHDGARHVYPLFWRHTSTVYAALSATY
jgi:hypothetical protein